MWLAYRDVKPNHKSRKQAASDFTTKFWSHPVCDLEKARNPTLLQPCATCVPYWASKNGMRLNSIYPAMNFIAKAQRLQQCGGVESLRCFPVDLTHAPHRESGAPERGYKAGFHNFGNRQSYLHNSIQRKPWLNYLCLTDFIATFTSWGNVSYRQYICRFSCQNAPVLSSRCRFRRRGQRLDVVGLLSQSPADLKLSCSKELVSSRAHGSPRGTQELAVQVSGKPHFIDDPQTLAWGQQDSPRSLSKTLAGRGRLDPRSVVSISSNEIPWVTLCSSGSPSENVRCLSVRNI